MGRIGFEGRYDYGGVGNAIILASRLSSEATAGEILIAQRTYAAIDGSIRADAAGERKLKGFSRPIAVYSVEPLDGGAADPDRVPAAEAS
jgi:class 3 adenylate cyclase